MDRRRRAEQALISVIATSYLLGVSTRRVDKLVQTLGIEGISKSQVSRMAKILDTEVEAFRNRPLDTGPYTYVWMDALTQKVREGGRVVQVSGVKLVISDAHEGLVDAIGSVLAPVYIAEVVLMVLLVCVVVAAWPTPVARAVGQRAAATTRTVRFIGLGTALLALTTALLIGP